jgi:alkanesulfonate monooxygenase SsuD/methylene tetrahydromethanopterin reductase-like flavin-dependent oxidoreductase (luciferase family)
MRFGIEFGSYSSDLDRAGVCRDMAERARLAQRSKYEAIFVAHHYSTGPDAAILQSLPLLSYFAGVVPGMYLGTSIFLLPMHQPLMVAEYTATLDNLCGGKFLFGIGQGYRDVEFNSMSVPKRERRERLVESVEVIKRLWTEDEVRHEGRFYRIDGVTIAPKPLQEPRPPILLGADAVKTVARVPEVADHWIASRRHTKPFLREALPAYKEALEKNGKAFKGLCIFRDLCIADSRQEAEKRIREGYERRYERYQRWGQPGERYDLPFEQLKQDRLILGSPAEVIEQVLDYHEEFGAEFMWFMIDWPGVDPRFTLETIQRFGEEVIPEIKRLTPECPLP